MVAKNVGWLHPGAGANLGDPFGPFFDTFDTALTAGGIQPHYIPQWCNGDESTQKLMQAAQALVANHPTPDIIVAPGGAITGGIAVAATSTIPVVFASGGDLTDLVQLGLSASNATGVVMGTTNSVVTRVSILRQLIGNHPEIAVFLRSGTKVYYKESDMATQQNLIPINASNFPLGKGPAGSVDFDKMCKSAKSLGASAVLVCADPSFTHQRAALIAAVASNYLPAAYPFKAYVYGGGLISVGPDLKQIYEQVGVIASQILNGTPPSKIPIYSANDLPIWINTATLNALIAAHALPSTLSVPGLTQMATASGGGVDPPGP